jgi:hypothetical protein
MVAFENLRQREASVAEALEATSMLVINLDFVCFSIFAGDCFPLFIRIIFISCCSTPSISLFFFH